MSRKLESTNQQSASGVGPVCWMVSNRWFRSEFLDLCFGSQKYRTYDALFFT